MKYRVLLAGLLIPGLFVFSCNSRGDRGKTSGQQTSESIIENLAPGKFKRALDQKNVLILDVRTPGEYDQGHLPNAKHIDYYGKKFSKNLEQLNIYKPVYVYCASGNRSSKAARIMKKKGFKAIYNLKGGIRAGMQQGLPVNR